MGNVLEDGTVVPKFYRVGTSESKSGAEINVSDPVLRMGQVTAVHYPGEEENYNGNRIEYDVKIVLLVKDGTATRPIIPRCRIATLFGGVADFFTWTPRPLTDPHADPTVLQPGSIVLLLCPNGIRRDCLIIGGAPHPMMPADSKDKGHHLDFAFNGITAGINKDGELEVKYGGATNADGSLVDSSSPGGSSFKFSNDGSLQLTSPDGSQLIKIDHSASKVSVLAHTFEVKSDKTNITGDFGVNINSNLTCNIKATLGLKVGAATDAFMKGTTYRAAEAAMHTSMLASIATLTGLMATAAANLQAAGVAMKVPTVGAVIGSVPMQAAATALTSMAAPLAALTATITAFEAGSIPYLSLLNMGD